MPTITDKTEFCDQDASQSRAGAGGSPLGEPPASPRSRRKRSGSGLREQLPDELSWVTSLLSLVVVPGGRVLEAKGGQPPRSQTATPSVRPRCARHEARSRTRS